MRVIRRLLEPQQAHAAWCALWADVKAALQAGVELDVEVRKAARSNEQNKLLHALIDEVADTVPWAGKLRDAETWKRLFVSAWCRTRNESVEILPALDGHGVDIVPARTSKLTKDELSDLVEFVQAWTAENMEQA